MRCCGQRMPVRRRDRRRLGQRLAAVRSRQSPPSTRATCSLMMPPVPVTNATSQSGDLRRGAAAHHLAGGVDDVVHAARHPGLPEGQLARPRC